MLTFRRLIALLALLCAGVSPAAAQSFTYSVYIDSDNNTATGCTVTLASGSIVGVRHRRSLRRRSRQIEFLG